ELQAVVGDCGGRADQGHRQYCGDRSQRQRPTHPHKSNSHIDLLNSRWAASGSPGPHTSKHGGVAAAVHVRERTEMSLDGRLARVFGLDGEQAWLRHANPWSVYTRIPVPVLLVIAIWSRAWIGWWCLLPIGIVVVWTMVNPRVFPPPRSLDHWASRAVLGETAW